MDKEIIGNGKIDTRVAQLVVTGNSNPIPEEYTIMGKSNFPNLIFALESNNLVTFDENTGVFVILHEGVLLMNATLNLHAQQASAEIRLIPEFNSGEGWISEPGKKVVVTAITPSQIEWAGLRKSRKGTQIRFCFSAISGNIEFKTEILDPGGLDGPVPAAIFSILWSREFEPMI